MVVLITNSNRTPHTLIPKVESAILPLFTFEADKCSLEES